MGRRVVGRIILAAVTVLATATAVEASGDAEPNPAPQPAGPVRILLHGDSVTQGSAGDWTWRYRLWKHLVSSGEQVDLIGPRDDLRDGSRAYADPGFDRDHAARWGMSGGALDHSVTALMAYTPDVIVDGLGVNDLRTSTPETVVARAVERVELARAVDPDVDVVLWRLPQTWRPGVAAYDDLVAQAVAALDTPRSRVVLADVATGFDRARDTFDSLHPSPTGEVKIAAAVADALASLGVGTPYPRPLVTPVNGPTLVPRLTSARVDAVGTLQVGWTVPQGATGAWVELRDVVRNGPWRRVASATTLTTATGSATVPALVAGRRYELRVRALKGTVASDRTSRAAAVVVPPPGRVAALRADRRGSMARLAWTPVPRARGYEVWRRAAGTWRRVAQTQAVRLTVKQGRRTARYRVRATGDAPGAWSVTRTVSGRAGLTRG